jgi:hypothetical protein
LDRLLIVCGTLSSMHRTAPLTLILTLFLSTISRAGPSSQPHGAWFTNPWGDQIILRDFAAAPFPHPSRADGFTAKSGTKYSADEHYRDSTIGVVISHTFDPASREIDLVIHFHGHANYVENVLDKYRLPEQLAASGKRSTILLVPQGPREVPDSNFGKLSEDAGALDALVDEVIKYLRDQKKIAPTATVGRIAITAHSGGYNAAGAVVARGAMKYADHITDVILFDATYGRLESFADWMKSGHGDRRLISIFTAHLAGENFELMTLLKKRGISDFEMTMETDVTPDLLRPRRALFIHTLDLPHDEVMQRREYFAKFLEASSLR